MMGAGGLPGEAELLREDIQWAAKFIRRELDTQTAWDRAARLELAASSLADPASALRALLADERAREALREMLTSEVVLAAARRAPTNNLCRPCEECARAAFDAAVDALASGVEGDAGTAGKGRP